jgi:hypothetical protein
MGIPLFRISGDKYQQQGCAPAQSTGAVVNIVMPKIPQIPMSSPPNPNPARWEIIEHYHCGNPTGNNYLVIKIRYPDCTNYEGVKIMVYHNVSLEQLTKQVLIDPHFSDKTQWISPVARFEPTERGWDMAVRFCRAMLGAVMCQ